MSVRIYEGENKANLYLLNKNEIIEGVLTSKIAYCDSIEDSRDVNNNPFYRIKLRDIEGNVVVGRYFNVENYDETGSIIRRLEGSIVKVEFKAEYYSKSLNLVLSEISIVSSPEQLGITPDMFLGMVKDLDKIIECIHRKIESKETDYDIYNLLIRTNKFVELVKHSHMEGVKGGRLGGGVWFVGRMLELIDQTLTGEKAQICKLQYCLAETINLRTKMVEDEVNNLLNSKATTVREMDVVLEFVSNKKNNVGIYEDFRMECNHVLNVILGMDEPMTLNAHIVKELRESLIMIEKIKDLDRNLAVKGVKRVNDLKLIKIR